MKKEPVKKRRGKARKDAAGAPATFEPGTGAVAPKVFDPGEHASALNLWWENGAGQSYIVGDGNGTWSTWPERKVLNLLRVRWVRLKAREGELLSEAEQVLMHAMTARRVEFSLQAIAGYPSGIYDLVGQRVLVRSSPKLVAPKEGDCGLIRAMIEAKLDLSDENKIDQTPYFYGWLQVALQGLLDGGPGNFRPGQFCIFAGPRDSGKSRIQHQIITGLLGGRSADPGPYLFGRTDFNGEMFASEHLMMEDPASSTKTLDRVFFGEAVKQLVVNDTQRLHRKREDAIIVSPFFRVTCSINDDPDKLRVLPLLTPDMKDKVHLFLVSLKPLPMPTGTLQERAAFRAAIAAQLPAFAWWLLNEFRIPDALRSTRFGVTHCHHPSLAMELFDDTPAAELLQLVDAAEFTVGDERLKLWQLESDAVDAGSIWEGTAIDLERLLLGDMGSVACSLAREAKRLFMHNKIDRLLSRLKEDQPERVAQHRTARERRWVFSRPYC